MDFPPTTVTTANFFVGFSVSQGANQLQAAFDETAPNYSNRSYVAGGMMGNIYDLNDNDLPVETIDSYGLVGNWLDPRRHRRPVGRAERGLEQGARLLAGFLRSAACRWPGIEDATRDDRMVCRDRSPELPGCHSAGTKLRLNWSPRLHEAVRRVVQIDGAIPPIQVISGGDQWGASSQLGN